MLRKHMSLSFTTHISKLRNFVQGTIAIESPFVRALACMAYGLSEPQCRSQLPGFVDKAMYWLNKDFLVLLFSLEKKMKCVCSILFFTYAF